MVNTESSGLTNVAQRTMGNRLDFGGGADRFVGSQTTLGVDQMRSKDGVDQSRFSETGLAYSHP